MPNKTAKKIGRTRAVSRALCLALLGGGVALAATTITPALAQGGPAVVNISAGPLSTALNQVASQMGLQIGFDSALVRGRTTAGLSGQYTPQEALDILLAGTGLRYTFSGPRTVTVAAGVPAVAAPTSVASGALAAPADTIMLETIVVEGEKIPRDIFETYTSVGVVTGQEIDDLNLQELGQAANLLANVRSLPSAEGNSQFTVRGLNAEGVTQPSRAAPVISVTVDGANQGIEATRRGSRGIWDVEQIEVLRGPQSTLQGRNSLGGAIIINTNDPVYVPELIVNGEIGTDEYLSGAAVANVPLIPDQMAIRVAAQAFQQDNDITYANPDYASLGEDKFEEVRAKLLLTPDGLPGFRGVFTVSHTHDKPFWNAVTGPDFYAREFDDDSGTAAEFRDTYVDRYIADLEYEFAPGWLVKSITAFAHTDVSIASPPASVFERADTRDIKDLSQDLRVSYDMPDAQLTGVLGLFAGHFTGDVTSDITTTQLAPFGIPVAAVQELTAENTTKTIAVYGEARYRVWDRWTLIGGGRLLRDEVSSDYEGRALDLAQTEANIAECAIIGCIPQPAYGSLDENSSVSNPVFLPKLGLAFDITDNQTIAATMNRGYRAGFAEAIPGTTQINQVDPEYLWSYELAYRSRWLDDRLQFNANGFYYDYENQQVLVFNPLFPGQTITVNSARSHAYGAEMEMRYRPLPELEVFGSLGLLHTEFDEGYTAEGDLAGKEFPEAPAVTATIGGLWRHYNGIFAAADLSYTDGYYSPGDLLNTPDRYIDSFTLVNAQAGYEYGHAKLSVFAQNLFDEDYLTSIGPDETFATIGQGRVVGLRGTVRF